MPGDDQEKTEQASPKKQADARQKGQVPSSRDVSSAVLILVVVLVFKSLGPSFFANIKDIMVQTFSSLSRAPMTANAFTSLMQQGMVSVLYIVGPIVGLMALVGGLSVILQHGVLWTTDPIMPQFSRIDPLAGFKRIFSATAIANLTKTVLKFLVIGFVAYKIFRDELPTVVTMTQLSLPEIVEISGSVLGRLVLKLGLVVAVIGAADLGFQRWDHAQKLKMSKQEVKDETKQAEGTPLVKSRIRNLQREMAKKRMMADVPTADVIVTNPTHLAVALRYKANDMGAPRVVAKGAGFIAERIKAIAAEHKIPVIENKPVARSLFKNVDIGKEIPSDIYRAVAEILAYVYKLRGKGMNGQN